LCFPHECGGKQKEDGRVALRLTLPYPATENPKAKNGLDQGFKSQTASLDTVGFGTRGKILVGGTKAAGESRMGKLCNLSDAVNRADFHALGSIEMSDAFHTGGGIDHEDIFAFRNRFRRAFRFASATGNTSFVNGKSHGILPQGNQDNRQNSLGSQACTGERLSRFGDKVTVSN
jgi:hypothetical protein